MHGERPAIALLLLICSDILLEDVEGLRYRHTRNMTPAAIVIMSVVQFHCCFKGQQAVLGSSGHQGWLDGHFRTFRRVVFYRTPPSLFVFVFGILVTQHINGKLPFLAQLSVCGSFILLFLCYFVL